MKSILIACFPISGLLFVVSLMIASGADPNTDRGQKWLAIAWGIRWLLPVAVFLAIIGAVFL